MPFYEYECSACKFYVEALQKISDPPMKKCPSCKKQTLKRLVSAPVFRLKGSGWYETDFKSDQENKRNLVESGDKEPVAESSADNKSDTKADAKSDAKSEAKSEAKPESKTTARSVSAKAAKSSGGKSSRPAKPKKPAKKPAKKK